MKNHFDFEILWSFSAFPRPFKFEEKQEFIYGKYVSMELIVKEKDEFKS